MQAQPGVSSSRARPSLRRRGSYVEACYPLAGRPPFIAGGEGSRRRARVRGLMDKPDEGRDRYRRQQRYWARGGEDFCSTTSATQYPTRGGRRALKQEAAATPGTMDRRLELRNSCRAESQAWMRFRPTIRFSSGTPNGHDACVNSERGHPRESEPPRRRSFGRGLTASLTASMREAHFLGRSPCSQGGHRFLRHGGAVVLVSSGAHLKGIPMYVTDSATKAPALLRADRAAESRTGGSASTRFAGRDRDADHRQPVQRPRRGGRPARDVQADDSARTHRPSR